jgi:D-alanyl-D-alanine endopeptidase (penicillin-binding protein 7)
MKFSGVLAALVVLTGTAGALVVTSAVAAPAPKKTVKQAAPATQRPAAKAPLKSSAKAPAKASPKAPVARSSQSPVKAGRSAPAVRKGVDSESRQVVAARASVRKGGGLGRTPRGVHTDRGAAAALAGAGIGAKAVQASLHQSAPETGGTPSIGEAIGLHRVPDPLALRSAVALVVDAGSGEILYDKNSNAVLPIASITKVMTAMVVLDARQNLNDRITIDESDRDTERSSSSRLPIGTTLTRAQLLQLALMSSENRAANALARNYPGGLSAYVTAANRKAAAIGMRDSVFADGTGLSSSNVSTARDLAVMVSHASRYPLIGEYSTASDLSVRTAHGARVFRTTNRMVASADWDLSMQKTGYINESGNCLVMRGKVDGRPVILVLLDSYGRYSRLGDAQRIRRWLEG